MKKKTSKYTTIKTAILIGLLAFAVFILISILGGLILSAIRKAGLLTEKNWMFLWVVDFVGLYIILGGILSIFTINLPVKRMLHLIQAMERISMGDFSVRLKRKKNLSKIVPKTVDMFNKMAHQLESTETLSHDFINNFSHEFKTPIASINGFAKLLKDDSLTKEEKDEYLDIIIQESERLSNLSINILTLSKLEQQSILTNQTEFNICEQIRIIIGSLYHKWSEKNIDIVFEGNDFEITANREMLGQVWVNLIDNAIKFAPENTQITLKIKSTDDGLIVRIINRIQNSADDTFDRIFDKFYQGDTSHATSGNGLGLPMVKRIIELHSGEITAEIRDNNEAVFSVFLPG